MSEKEVLGLLQADRLSARGLVSPCGDLFQEAPEIPQKREWYENVKHRISHDFINSPGGIPHRYDMRVNINGVITVFPVFQPKGEPIQVKKDEPGGKQLSVFKKEKEKSYDRKNKITLEGCDLRTAAKAKIKNAIMFKYYDTRGDLSRRLKFFTYTVQEKQYKNLLSKFDATRNKYTGLLEEIDRLNDENARATRHAERQYILKRLSENQHPDQFYIKKFSMHLENLQKVKEGIKSYVWVAEKTDLGVIHFHCVFETKFLSAKDESKAWADRCGFENYFNSVQYGIDRKHAKGSISNKAINSAKNSNGYLDPRVIANYITKYVTKNQSVIFGRVYGMSKNFTAAGRSGTDRFQMPHMSLRDNEVTINFYSPNYYQVDTDTGEVTSGAACIRGKLVKVKTIEGKSGHIPIFVISSDQQSILKNCFPELFRRNKFLFKAQNDQDAKRRKELTRMRREKRSTGNRSKRPILID